MNSALMHHYKEFRRHQLETYGDSGLWIGGKSARQFTGGGAAYQFHAVAAIASARGQIRFRKDLSERIRESERRSKAAKKGHAQRKTANQF